MKLFSRGCFVLAVFCFPLLLASHFVGDFGARATKENLDLPFEAMGGGDPDDDGPEVYYVHGLPLEGDAIFYVVDRSSSMQDRGELDIAKREIVRNLLEFSNTQEFGIVFFDAGVVQFPASGQPAQASPGMKSSAISFLQGVTGGHGSCVQQGLAAALRMANLATARRKVIVYLGDGRGHCHGAAEATYLRTTLAAITAQNYQRVQINCILVLDVTRIGADFMHSLARLNNGNYVVKNR